MEGQVGGRPMAPRKVTEGERKIRWKARRLRRSAPSRLSFVGTWTMELDQMGRFADGAPKTWRRGAANPLAAYETGAMALTCRKSRLSSECCSARTQTMMRRGRSCAGPGRMHDSIPPGSQLPRHPPAERQQSFPPSVVSAAIPSSESADRRAHGAGVPDACSVLGPRASARPR